jgi:hypothetical protein
MGADSAEQREARCIASGSGAAFALAAVCGFARTGEFVETNQSDLGSPVPFAKIFRFTRRANHLYKFAPSHPTRGAYHDRHERGVGCGGRGSVLRAMGLQGESKDS